MGTLLRDLLVTDAVKLNITVNGADQVIQILGAELFKAGYVKGSFIQAVCDREKKLPTGLPLNGSFNAAIPHTDINHVLKPGVGLAVLSDPIMFMNMVSPDERVPVSLIFLIAIDDQDTQIEMLQDIANILQKPEKVRKLIYAESLEDVKSIISNQH